MENDRASIPHRVLRISLKTVMGTLSFENNISSTFWSVGQWQDGVFRGVKGNDVDGAVGVRVKDGWAD